MVGIDYYKKNKILIAVIEKGRSRTPSMDFNFDFLFDRCMEEMKEISDRKFPETKIQLHSLYSLMVELERGLEYGFSSINVELPPNFFELLYKELADVSNFVDFMFNRASIVQELLRQHEAIP